MRLVCVNRWICFLIFGLCVAGAAFGMGETPQAAPEAKALAQDFTLENLEGQEVSLSDYRGKVVFLNFWATWCPPCRAEMPSMQNLYERFKDKDFVMLAVSLDQLKSAAIIFMKEKKYSFPVLLDLNKKVATQYKVSGIPTTYIIDKEGRMVSKIVGGRDWEDKALLQELEELIIK